MCSNPSWLYVLTSSNPILRCRNTSFSTSQTISSWRMNVFMNEYLYGHLQPGDADQVGVCLQFAPLRCHFTHSILSFLPQQERKFLNISNYIFMGIFTLEMLIKVLAKGFFIGKHAYLHSGWNVMDGCLVAISWIDVIITLASSSSPQIFGILRVFRLLRTLRPLRLVKFGFCLYLYSLHNKRILVIYSVKKLIA